MYLFDTDTYSNFIIAHRNFQNLRARVANQPAGSIYLNSVVVSEFLRLVLNVLDRHKAWNNPGIIHAYKQFDEAQSDFKRFPILPFDTIAHEEYLKIPEHIRKRHPQDCRIAAIALSRGFIVVTRNILHFENIAPCEDWTA